MAEQQTTAKQERSHREHYLTLASTLLVILVQVGTTCYLDQRKGSVNYEAEIAKLRASGLQEVWLGLDKYSEALDLFLDQRGDYESAKISWETFNGVLKKQGIYLGTQRLDHLRSQLELSRYMASTSGKNSPGSLRELREYLGKARISACQDLHDLLLDASKH
jgi:hypothetical protein